ncbi:Hypothetical predicted protein [Scomber scombrus]|uniref:Uncharacterized protein n=1 Tax=Scomber scombrus TaxID=13677 RepID=A0AAV1NP81_SCOSC
MAAQQTRENSPSASREEFKQNRHHEKTMLIALDSNLILRADSYILKRGLILDITNIQYRMMRTYFVLNRVWTLTALS